MSQHTGSNKNSLNLLGEKYLNDSHWSMRRIRLLECRDFRNATLSFIHSSQKRVEYFFFALIMLFRWKALERYFSFCCTSNVNDVANLS